MPTISPNLIPTKAPGTIFDALTGGDETLNIRWLTASDPAYFESLNRPHSDLAVRQLVIAKAVDNLELQLGHQALFPFLVQPRIASGSDVSELPLQWIWGLSVSLPKKWEILRLAKILRMSGDNDVTSGYSGVLRFVFSGSTQGSETEVALFYADYEIDSDLTYQPARVSVATTDEDNTAISPSESETVAGFITFRTLDNELLANQTFFDLLAPPDDTTDSNADGFFDDPAVYEIVDTVAGGASITDDFGTTALNHGTGVLSDNAWNAIPELDSDIQSWIVAFNFPFDAEASRTSANSIEIPAGLFREFDITAPAGDNPTADTSGLFFPVYVSRIERRDDSSTQLRFYFATYNVTDEESDGAPSTTPVEFAVLDLSTSMIPGDIVEITPIENLKLETGTDGDNFGQHFGRGHVVLSSLWGGTTTEVADFFEAFDSIATDPADTSFSAGATRISAFGISRVPKYIPTIGQSRALNGSTSRLDPPIHPDFDNRYVTEQDQGLGQRIDLEAEAGITANANIERYGYSGSLCHRAIKMVVDAGNLGNDSSYYDTHILPRLTILLGRAPAFGDIWFNGTRFMFYNGDSWQS